MDVGALNSAGTTLPKILVFSFFVFFCVFLFLPGLFFGISSTWISSFLVCSKYFVVGLESLEKSANHLG